MKGPIVFLLVVLSMIAIDGRQRRLSWYCSSIRHRACYPYGENLLCGSDNYTYYNKCDFSKSHCMDTHLHVAHEGSCNGESHLGSNLTQGELLLLQFMCDDITGHRCDENFDAVCGSNGVSYFNECEYEQTRCMHPDLTLAHRGPCAA
ncbi:thrombin inhibitor rhodniin-like [Argopecten irradians]|uniref:thrombin inhibitor rhodniin-like n=1 Tax=Argopecten irradians TaxID=31199 RepID=UPI0037191E24